jgi:hypothetical protein
MARKRLGGSAIQEELKIYSCMGIDSCKNCPFQSFAKKGKAIKGPICASNLKLKLENRKIISEAIDSQFYQKKIELSIKMKQKPAFIANSL